jgi:hypothetical protein
LLRTAALLVLTALALTAASASAAPTAARGISPSLVHQGQKTTLTARVAKNALCKALLQFSDGKMLTLGPKRAPKGNVTFVVRIPAAAAVGQGRWSVNCNVAPSTTGPFVVVTAKSTASTVTARVVVAKQGFSQKPDAWGQSSHVSFGLVLHNDSSTDDAVNVYLIVNMVDGEIVNDNSPLTLMSVNLSIVILDASGVPIGGGSGSSNAAQPPNTRFVFLAQQGFDAIPLSRAASVVISASPTYGPPL